MTPIVATQLSRRLDPRWIKLTAEVRAAGFRSGSSHTILAENDELELRPFPRGKPREKLDSPRLERVITRRGFRTVKDLTADWSKRYQPLLQEVRKNGTVPRIPE